jgi:hypothetical protein
LAGRYTDLKLSDHVIHQRGLHVITAYMPPNIRVQIQAFARSARAGQPGSAQFIVYSNEEETTIADLLTARDDKESYQLQLSAMNQWALWLDRVSSQIQLVEFQAKFNWLNRWIKRNWLNLLINLLLD